MDKEVYEKNLAYAYSYTYRFSHVGINGVGREVQNRMK
jgi:hypothetical protein